ncbi:Asp-tRNA(Asn)/Glu-tRNA(Gln) amidotransferase subunit GatC [Bernardetia sp.]|uniref:Asp-tRNA(Asn)/Glu-tRNA(Gln) amidotransferase subunit GatC n=1 Tax=Bernardetia sp. TaxID=1937974 RepID=UPI0025C0617F|nr:Asp-tRNA(Asn)/Glu-tRNA(Gln) amidotransferase subunit GatC [Bernardetia sp.]
MKVTVDKKLIEDISHLSRLEFSEEDKTAMADDLNEILDWVEQLDEIDTSDTEPLTHISTEINVMRNDEVKDVLPHDKALKNAPKKDSDYFRTPKVIE